MSGLRIEQVVTSGTFSLDGEDFDVDNNVWLLGDDDRVLVVDAAHDAGAIADAVGGRRAVMVLATHGHNDHINAAVELSERLHAPVALHPDDTVLWDAVHPGRSPDLSLDDGQVIELAGTHLRVLHTPGHSPGGVCVHVADLGVVFSGDTLFQGGPGATGRSFSDRAQLLGSIERQLLPLPASTVVHTGHGPDTTIGAEAPQLPAWRAQQR